MKNTSVEISEETLLEERITVEAQKDLVLYNDDVNTFDFVIECLVEICKHNSLQAEQCAFLVHYKGKCGIKRGSEEELKSLCLNLLDRGLSAKIE